MVFSLPERYGVKVVHPLVYVEWCTPFQRRDPVTGMYVVSLSTRTHNNMQHAYGEIVSADRIARNCYLMPKCGKHKDSSWTSYTVGDRCKTFYFNPYVDYHMYCQFVLGKYGCIPS